MNAIGTGVPMGENNLLLPREPRETPSQTPYKVVYVAQGVLSLAAFGYLMKESITERTVTAVVGAAACLISTVGAGVGFWNANRCQKAFKIDSQQEARDFSVGSMVNVTEEEHEETSGKKQLEEQIRHLQEELGEQKGIAWRKDQELIALESKHKLATDKTLEEVKSAKAELNRTIDLLQCQLEEQKKLVNSKEHELTSLRGQLESAADKAEEEGKSAKQVLNERINSLQIQVEENQRSIVSLKLQIADLTSQNDLLTENAEAKENQITTLQQLHEITLNTLENKKAEIASLKELLHAPQLNVSNVSSDTSRSETDRSSSTFSPIARMRTSKGDSGDESD